MKCPHCGYDKILPMYKFCPQCKQPLNSNASEAPKVTSPEKLEQPNTKLLGMLLMSYKKAIENPKGFGEFCKKHPNDSKRLWNKWESEGRDLSALQAYTPTDDKPATASSKEDNVTPSQQHTAATEGAHAAAATAASRPKVAESDVVAVGSRNKERNYVTWSIAPGQIARNISALAFQELEKVDGVYKTGLYVKDEVTGIGTLTYIDPSTKIYGALGHEIIESTTSELVEVKTGQIFESTVTSINKSIKGNAGSKNASFNLNHLYGNILTNETHGIYGNYTDDIPEANIDIALPNEIKVGKASLYTVLDGQDKQAYDISITDIREYNDVKYITFTITDEDLLAKTGGVIQGMSGSPIVQNDKLIGAVTHVVVDNPLTGYGIFITTMLETGDQFAH